MNIDKKILDGLNYCKELDVLKYFKSDSLFINNDKMLIDGQDKVRVHVTTEGKSCEELNEAWTIQHHIDKIGNICKAGSCMELGWICDNIRYYALYGGDKYNFYPYHNFEKYVDEYNK